MTPQLPQADPIALPAPVWLLWALLILTFTLHVVPMNLLLGGSIIGAVARLRASRSAHAAALAARIAASLPIVVAATVTLGVAALLFLQVLYGRLFFTSAVLIAVPWIAVVPILIASYYGAYGAAIGVKKGRQPGLVLSWAVAVGFAVIAFIYANAMGLMLRPAEFLPRFQASASGLQLSLSDPTLVPRFLHMLLGALAVAGLGVAVWGAVVGRRDVAWGAWAVRHGVMWAAIATVLNFLPGFWWLVALPKDTLLQFMGRDGFSTAIFGLAIVAALGALGHLVGATFASNPAKLLYGGASSLAVTVVLMILMRDRARSSMLASAGFTSPDWVAPQWGPIAIFAVLLVAAVGLVVWMVRALVKAGQTEKVGV